MDETAKWPVKQNGAGKDKAGKDLVRGAHLLWLVA